MGENKLKELNKVGDILKSIDDIILPHYEANTCIYVSKGNFYRIVDITNITIHIVNLNNDNKNCYIYESELNNFINLREHRDKIINDLLDGK